MNRYLLIFCILFSLTIYVNATTWVPAKHTCPVCKNTNEYQQIASYGGYIYQWPSKYQYVYWPLIDFPSVYCCPDCYFSTIMWDFDSIPDNKIDTLKKFLSTIKLEKKYNNYINIPMTTRLEIAENVYKILGRDTEFWCKFYRVMGYHYEVEKNAVKAKESRLTSQNLARQMLSDSQYKGQEKEILFIIAAMYNFIGQKDSAMVFLDQAALQTYKNKTMKKEDVKGFDRYLTELINDYKEFIKKEEEN